jgi:hypothetical protein
MVILIYLAGAVHTVKVYNINSTHILHSRMLASIVLVCINIIVDLSTLFPTDWSWPPESQR